MLATAVSRGRSLDSILRADRGGDVALKLQDLRERPRRRTPGLPGQCPEAMPE